MKRLTPHAKLTIKIPDTEMRLDFDPNRKLVGVTCVEFELKERGIVANLVLPDCFYRRRVELRPGNRRRVVLQVRKKLRPEKYPFVVRRKKVTAGVDALGPGPDVQPEAIEEELDANPGY